MLGSRMTPDRAWCVPCMLEKISLILVFYPKLPVSADELVAAESLPRALRCVTVPSSIAAFSLLIYSGVSVF